MVEGCQEGCAAQTCAAQTFSCNMCRPLLPRELAGRRVGLLVTPEGHRKRVGRLRAREREREIDREIERERERERERESEGGREQEVSGSIGSVCFLVPPPMVILQLLSERQAYTNIGAPSCHLSCTNASSATRPCDKASLCRTSPACTSSSCQRGRRS